MYEIFEKLCREHGITPYRVCKDLGIPTGTTSNWKAGRYTPKADKMQRIADYFGVGLEYIMTGKEKNNDQLTAKDERDIKKKLDSIMSDIRDANDGPLYYNGEKASETDLYLIENAIESAMKQIKIVNKEKYNPYKNKRKK